MLLIFMDFVTGLVPNSCDDGSGLCHDCRDKFVFNGICEG